MRRILFVIDSLSPLGLFSQLKPLVENLQGDYEVHVAVLGIGAADKPVASQDYTVHRMGDKRRALERCLNLKRLIGELAPQFIHAWGSDTHVPVLLADNGGRAMRRFSWFEREESNSVTAKIIRAISHRRDDIFIFSHPSLLPASAPRQRCEIIANTITSTSPDRAAARQKLLEQVELSDNVFLVGTVSSHRASYRLKDLVWAIDLLCCVRSDVHLLVFGHGQQRPLCRFIKKTLAGKNVHLLSLDDADVADLAGLDAYWNAQRQQPIPSAMIDCMSFGVAAISVLDKETEELVMPLQSALATNFGARDEFARWTKYLIEQPEAAATVAEQGQSHVEKLFKTENMVDSYRKLFDESEG